MHRGEYGELISDTSPWPGSIGDSAHNTAREIHLKIMLGESATTFDMIVLALFRSERGYLRHWTAPEGWREDDATSDMCLPLYLAYRECAMHIYAQEMKSRIINNFYRTGNNTPINPKLWALIHNSKTMLNVTCAAQILLFKIPIRWSDSTKSFESNKNSSADYLNFIHASIHCDQWVRDRISKDKLKERVRHYYSNESNIAFLIDLYDRVIDKYWSK